VSDVVAKGWVAAVRRGIGALPEAESEVVLSHVAPRLSEVLELARRVETGSRKERSAAVEVLIERMGVDTPELIDFAAAAVRLGVQEAADASGWTAATAGEVGRRATEALREFDRQIEELAAGLATSSSLAAPPAATWAAPVDAVRLTAEQVGTLDAWSMSGPDLSR
jgi:hypothetical protein